jgi:hypothetical protein
MRHTDQFSRLVRQVAIRRSALLKSSLRQDILPPAGSVWYPSQEELARTDAFVVFFIAELENYFEDVIESALNIYQEGIIASGLANCGAGPGYVQTILDKRKLLAKNNNTGWDRTSQYWTFVGLNKGVFPVNLWDDVDFVTSERGAIVHRSLGLRVITDPRLTVSRVRRIIRQLRLFDRDFFHWQSHRAIELARLNISQAKFLPGIGMISTS